MHWVPNDQLDRSSFCQGDILKCLDHKVGGHEYLFVLTADCDIAQNKAGNRLSCLEIVRAERFVEDIWAVEQLQRSSRKEALSVANRLNPELRKMGLNELRADDMLKWAFESTPDSIISACGFDVSREKKLYSTLEFLKDCAKHYDRPLNLLNRYFNMKNISLRSRIIEALTTSGGFQDYMFLPELPNEDGVGFVILLRSIVAKEVPTLYPSHLDALSRGQEAEFFRIGRLSDALRHAVAQRLAFLFSRIGMASEFEDLCEIAATFVADAFERGD